MALPLHISPADVLAEGAAYLRYRYREASGGVVWFDVIRTSDGVVMTKQPGRDAAATEATALLAAGAL
jgi:hypothetical protein